MKKTCYTPIGIIHSPHTDPRKTPIQPVYARGCQGTGEIFPEYEEGLQDLDGFSHIYIIYHLHMAGPPHLKTKPFLEDRVRGIFATRSPRRPNPIGLSIVRLLGIDKNILYLNDLDILDGTPILDIKPFISRFESPEKIKSGWQENIPEVQAKLLGKRDFTGK
ncbi:MAG: tRNA (N6-threonylcarbamoyladenosine(37)-N6)-methyltransferase TrmO [Candidatus Eremiobacteraeota bacterium]|nr:tRNA (N6-threonylcarbamoyladenosine(37)-N6)-methyltransferase TrmO [Candidatus Eremiobacteraeota bacterium]